MSGKAFVVTMAVATVTVFFGISIGFVFLQLSSQARQVECENNLKQIALAIHNYHDTFGQLPSAQLIGHSWRVRLGPFREQSSFFDQYRFDEAWDGEWNRNLEIQPEPDKVGKLGGGVDETGIRYAKAYYLWQCPSDRESESPHTNYLMPVGPGAIGLPGQGRKLADITDDHSTTILIAETASRDIEWLQPKDLDVETMSFQINDPDSPSISSHHPGGALVVFCDGTVGFLSSDLPPEVVKAMITIDGGEIIEKDEDAPGGYRLSEFRTN
ncbi:DUF1559 domain-containing protein [Blastopirellula marina]|uniref:DUF1559 domain-containing protein n=1 Tax=Blastopirellula marina TaxID=124 RepID=A0A2S8GD55_9BACT|nr:DUF1559 domain-containing protein [Blastopirellula marina]PQO42398.1 hypothetical protein C5Y93_29140 [Blastopirellula marina]